MDIQYIPRTADIDDVLREPTSSVFTTSMTIEAYFHDVANFGGDGDIMSKFGFQQVYTVSLSISKKRFRSIRVPDRPTRPFEGDIVYLPFAKAMFQINFVEHEDPFWQLGRFHVFKLKCSLYTRGYNEKFTTPKTVVNDTGNAVAVDELEHHINDALKTKSDVLLDFTEQNPFGDA